MHCGRRWHQEKNDERAGISIKAWSSFCNNLPTEDRRKDWLREYANRGIGLALGLEVEPGYRLAAVDVDDDRLVPVTKLILGECAAGKRGMKGETYFVRAIADKSIASTSLRDPDKQGKIDILINGRMSVLPPTVHPGTNSPYEWLGSPFLAFGFGQLPILDERKLATLKLIVGMSETWVLVSGRTTHDAALTLAVNLLAGGLTDEETLPIAGALLPGDYAGNLLHEWPEMIASARSKGLGSISHLPLDDSIARHIEKDLEPMAYVSGDGFLRDWALRLNVHVLKHLNERFARPKDLEAYAHRLTVPSP